MRVDMSPSVFLALCGLVKDALEVPSDATPVLKKAAGELSAALQALEEIPPALEQHAEVISNLAEEPSDKSQQAVA